MAKLKHKRFFISAVEESRVISNCGSIDDENNLHKDSNENLLEVVLCNHTFSKCLVTDCG